MSEFVLKSLRGGMNNSDPAISLPDDQCVLATNVEFNKSMLGERRRGCSAITLPASLSGKDRITFLHRHLPTTDETASQLWAFGLTGAASSQLSFKDTAWTDVAMSDAPTLTGFSPYRLQAVSLHGKMFLAYDSAVDRLHVWDGTSLRKVGLAEPAAPTGANTAAGGTFSGTRYYRVRYTVQSGGVTLRRSEPSDALTFAPSGVKTGVTVTKPASISESETHWELEASLDNANFFRIATTVVGTTTFDDTTDSAAGYAQTYPLSEDVGDYTLPISARYLAVDADRLIMGGSWEQSAAGSRVSWTPTALASGSGNDERTEEDTDPSLDLDGFEGGELTGLSSSVAGSVYAFKRTHIYKLVRTGARSQAYDVVSISKACGALHGSVVQGVDQMGRPCIYFLDPNVGPCRYGAGGLQWCGSDIRESWDLVNLDATKSVCSGVYDPQNRQVQWAVAVSSSDFPNFGLVLQTDSVRDGEDGTHKGWVTWDGLRTKAYAQVLYSSNIEAGTARNRDLRPFIGTEGSALLHLCDTGTTDNGTSYTARIVTKSYVLGTILRQFRVRWAMLMAKAVVGAVLTVKVTRDLGLESASSVGVSCAPEVSETQVFKKLDDLSLSEMRAVQVEFVDSAPSTTTRWELNQMCMDEDFGGQ